MTSWSIEAGMSARAKFLFDLDFAAGEHAEAAEPTITVRAHEAALAEAQTQAYRNGFAGATAAAAAKEEERAAAALTRIAAAFEDLLAGLSVIEGRLESEAVEVAVAVARKLAPALIIREPMAEIVALATDCFGHLVAAPHLAVRVNDG